MTNKFLAATFAAICWSGVAFAAPHICLMDLKGDDMAIDRDRMNPIRGDVNPDGSVTYHFKDNNPPPITINGNEPMPFPVPGLNRVLQQHLHKKARHDYQACLSRELEEKHRRHGHGEKK